MRVNNYKINMVFLKFNIKMDQKIIHEKCGQNYEF